MQFKLTISCCFSRCCLLYTKETRSDEIKDSYIIMTISLFQIGPLRPALTLKEPRDYSQTRSAWVVKLKQLTKICWQLTSSPSTTDLSGKVGLNHWAGALVQWLWEETHVPKVVGSNPRTVYWMDICLLQKLYCLFEKTKINKKRLGMAHFKNVYRQTVDWL